MKLKHDYEMTFKEGFRLGARLTRAKACLENARNAKLLRDEQMFKLQMEFASSWTDLARNAGRKFTPTVAHEPSNRHLILATSNTRSIYLSCHLRRQDEHEEVQKRGSSH